jgi:hypothetical protein
MKELKTCECGEPTYKEKCSMCESDTGLFTVSVQKRKSEAPRVLEAFCDLAGSIPCKNGDRVALIRAGGFDAVTNTYFDMIQPDERFRPVYHDGTAVFSFEEKEAVKSSPEEL